ncbi:hypothetical protein VP1G_09777 [Cytospora mali]|uniref:NADAR domain-containing protein n=1 Tax=Cytospora mali TaxID=578113 RepID=A0A194VF63_CYTMA|nr:hypothetical protein VP1G_09777 [Valsa mali var. pyri (nom. inval.)]
MPAKSKKTENKRATAPASPRHGVSAAKASTSTENSTGLIYFFRETEQPHGWMSQWYAYPTRDGNDTSIIYPTAEHYMMYQKAKLFNDDEMAAEILAEHNTHPHKAKELGRGVRDFDEGIWERERYRIVEEGTWLKVTRPVDDEGMKLKMLLLDTGDRELVEASPFDRVWGIGFRAKDAGRNREQWGLNLLGKALMAVRERLREEEAGPAAQDMENIEEGQ